MPRIEMGSVTLAPHVRPTLRIDGKSEEWLQRAAAKYLSDRAGQGKPPFEAGVVWRVVDTVETDQGERVELELVVATWTSNSPRVPEQIRVNRYAILTKARRN